MSSWSLFVCHHYRSYYYSKYMYNAQDNGTAIQSLSLQLSIAKRGKQFVICLSLLSGLKITQTVFLVLHISYNVNFADHNSSSWWNFTPINHNHPPHHNQQPNWTTDGLLQIKCRRTVFTETAFFDGKYLHWTNKAVLSDRKSLTIDYT